MDNCCIFAGPSLSGTDYRVSSGMHCYPPAMRGDIYQAVENGHSGILLVDGYFLEHPAVLHKELLWARSKGLVVMGASSMGALRASETVDDGVVGFGWIYEAYVRGRYQLAKARLHIVPDSSEVACTDTVLGDLWENALNDQDALIDDDDVAVTHGPLELDYKPICEAMVNVIQTARAAPFSSEFKRSVLREAKTINFSERTYSRIVEHLLSRQPENRTEIKSFQLWSTENRVDQKKVDALGAIEYFRDNWGSLKAAAAKSPPKFVETTYWAQLKKPAQIEDESSLG